MAALQLLIRERDAEVTEALNEDAPLAQE